MRGNVTSVQVLTAHTRAVVVYVLLATQAFALDPNKKMTQFAHQSWGAADGIDRVYSIAQTKDGYMWFGTGRGLLRFDGVHFSRWETTAGEPVPSGFTTGLLARQDGSLWSVSRAGWLRISGGHTEILPRLGAEIWSAKLIELADGTVRVAGHGVQTYVNGHFEMMDTNLAGEFFRGIVEDQAGTLWVSAQRQSGDARGSIEFLTKEGTNFIMPHHHSGTVADLKVAPDGTIWAAETGRSVWGFVRSGSDIKVVTPEIKVGSLAILFDRDGALWITTIGDGLRRIRNTKTMGTNDIGQFSTAADIFTQQDGLSGNVGAAIFEDREGNIWVGTTAGLDCFQENKITTYSAREGLPVEQSPTLQTAPDGVIWAGNSQGFAQLSSDGKIIVDRKWFDLTEQRRPGSPSQGYVRCAYRTQQGRMMFGTSFGLVELQSNGTAAFVTSDEGKVLDDVLCVGSARNGGLWVDGTSTGLRCLNKGKLQSLQKLPELSAIFEDGQNRLWLGLRDGGLYVRDGGKFHSDIGTNGLITGEICSISSDAKGRIIFVGDGGISRFDNGSFTLIDRHNGLPEDQLATVVTDDSGNYWFGGASTIFRLTPAELDYAFAAKTNFVLPEVYDLNDGLRGFIIQPSSGIGYPLATKGLDGKLWFSTARGLAVIDPAHILKNTEPPPVQIQKIIAAGKTYDSSGQLAFPAGTRSCEIDYVGLGFAKAMKVRYKYKLSNADPDWVDAGIRRQALYQNLKPGRYMFQVLACNCDGIWNASGDTAEFSILPAFYETAWFRVVYVMPVVLAAWGLYRLRIAQITKRVALQLEGQIKERKRIAQELHDTLLQGFTGIGLKLDAIMNKLPDSLYSTKEQLRKILDQSDQYLTEARRAVWELRASSLEKTDDFAEAILVAAERILEGTGIKVSFSVSGTRRKLSPVIEDNLLRICEEAVTNAVKHAQPTAVLLNLEFLPQKVHLRIKDDGCGFDPQGQGSSKSGHFGLAGISERVSNLAGSLVLDSQPGKGTEIIVTVATS